MATHVHSLLRTLKNPAAAAALRRGFVHAFHQPPRPAPQQVTLYAPKMAEYETPSTSLTEEGGECSVNASRQPPRPTAPQHVTICPAPSVLGVKMASVPPSNARHPTTVWPNSNSSFSVTIDSDSSY